MTLTSRIKALFGRKGKAAAGRNAVQASYPEGAPDGEPGRERAAGGARRRPSGFGPSPLFEAGRPRRLSLALQGGGALGAFAWGVLDRLLKAEDLSFDTLSGSSAGAVNAVLLAAGLAAGGPAEARAKLSRFWLSASRAAAMQGFKPVMSWASSVMSPYQFNPFDFNPLRDLLLAEVDFEQLRARAPVRLMLGATRVADGRLRLFRETEVSVETVLASACLPSLARAVTIEGEAYWDGGYTANPPLLPLVQASTVPDLVVVQIIPTLGMAMPRSSSDITRRLAQITFNTSLLRDLDLLHAAKDVGDKDWPTLFRKLDKNAKLRLHHVSAEDFVADLPTISAIDLDARVMTRLHAAGRIAAEQLLEGGEPAQAAQIAGMASAM